MLGGLAQNGRLGQGMSLNGQGQLTGSKQNQRQALGESRPQSQNNRMTQHSQGAQSQQSQQFNQMHLNSLTHHNLGKGKQMNFSPGFQQLQHYNQDHLIKQ